MEVNEVRRGGRVVSAPVSTEKKSGPVSAPAQARADRMALSRQAVNYLEEQNRLMTERAREEGGSAKKDLYKDMDKKLKKMDKCQRIYARVVNGDKVPPEDLRYLEQCDPEGYKLALAMRRPNKHPKEWKSVLDDEDRADLEKGECAAPETPERS